MVTLTQFWFDGRVFDKLDLASNKTIKFTNKVLNNGKLVSPGLISDLVQIKSNKTICGLPRTALVKESSQ